MCKIDKFCLEVGAGRSGTNFLGEVLSSHPELAYWRRPKYIWRHGNAWKRDDCLRAEHARPGVQRYIHNRFHEYMKERGKERLLVCTQSNTLALEFVNKVFPDGKIIHIIRDGREVAMSAERIEWRQHASPKGRSIILHRVPEVPKRDLPAYGWEFLANSYKRLVRAQYRYSWGPKIKNWRKLDRSMGKLEFCALTWRECVSAARRVGMSMPKDRYFEIRFEDLICKPEEIIPAMLEFMELPPAKEIDEFIEKRIDRSKAGHWLEKASPEALERVAPYVNDLCKELGYI